MAKATVLLTGISGYIGLHCAKELLEQGFEVRGSIRNLAKEQEVRKTLEDASVDMSNLKFVELDLLSDKGWEAAAEGCDYIMHVASPFAMENPKDENDMIKPAVEGSLRALRAGKKAGVKRVVLTSSIVAMMGSRKTGIFTNKDWTDPNDPGINTYTKSKTLAEKAAWKFMEEEGGSMELVTVNPGAVLGPALGSNITGQTMDMFRQMLVGKMPMVPNMAFPMVDVRDVAIVEVKAMLSPEAAGKRMLTALAKPESFMEIAKLLKANGYKYVGTRKAPSFLLKFMALFSREAKGMVAMIDTNVGSDNTATRELLEWDPISVQDSVLDTAKALEKVITEKQIR